MNLDELYLLVRNSVFNKNYYSVDIGLKKVLQIIDYLGYEINIKEKLIKTTKKILQINIDHFLDLFIKFAINTIILYNIRSES